MENQNQIVELTQAETEQVEGGLLIAVMFLADVAIYAWAFDRIMNPQ